MHRRRFVELALGGVAFASIAGVAACRSAGPCDLPATADPAWSGMSARQRGRAVAEAALGEHLEDAVAVGRAYLELPGVEERLDAFRCEHVEGQVSLNASLQSISSAIEADYSDRNVINVQGWVLSEAELMRCALVV